MRLDLFLKVSRLCPQRTLAHKLCDAGFVLLNGRPAKPAHEVKVRDEIVIRSRNQETTARVQQVPTSRNVSRHDANLLIEIVSKKELRPEL